MSKPINLFWQELIIKFNTKWQLAIFSLSILLNHLFGKKSAIFAIMEIEKLSIIESFLLINQKQFIEILKPKLDLKPRTQNLQPEFKILKPETRIYNSKLNRFSIYKIRT